VDCLAHKIFETLVTRSEFSARISIAGFLDPANLVQPEAASTVRSALTYRIVAQLKDQHGQLSAGHLDSVLRLAQSGQPGKRIQLPGGVDVLREKDSLLFRRRT
jgi:hypothetical protein